MTESSVLIQTLLVAPTGIMGSSLRTFLRTIPGTRVVDQVSCLDEALKILARYQPNLLLLDADAANGNLNTSLGQLRLAAPALNLIVLANSWNQRQDALNAGASSALLKGCLDDQLRQAILAVQYSQP